MANVKISELPSTTAVTGSDVVPVVQSGLTKQVSFSDFLASPTLFASGIASFLSTPSSANLRAALTDETGTGPAVFATSPTIDNPTVTGVVAVPDGTAAAPALTNTGDTNTGVFFPADNTVAVTTDGTERVRVDASGNLGLGVTPATWRSGAKAFQFGSVGAVWQQSNGYINLGYNAYEDGTNTFKYFFSDAAARFGVINGYFAWFTAPSGTAGDAISFTQAMTLDASGNLGVGTTSPASRLHLQQSTGTVTFRVQRTASDIFDIYQGSGITYLDSSAAGGVLAFATVGTERARITSDGNFCIGKTSASEFAASGTGYGFASSTTDPFFSVVNTNAAGNNGCIYLNKRNTNPSNSLIVFISNNGTTDSGVGSITHNGTSTAYNTSSDYRLKENIQPMTGALAKVAQLKPCTYTWKVDGSAGQGFIAHELAEVVPDAVTGEKDAVNEDGSIKAQGIDTSFLVATLTAAIQEQQALIQSLTARIEALEAQS